jgi:catechol 2,3-dioxygenase-like lactoylglutathione lyase family enzyme
MRLGDLVVHLRQFPSDQSPLPHQHFGIAFSNPEDFELLYQRALSSSELEEVVFGVNTRALPDGSVQFYIQDPSGNRIEAIAPDINQLDLSVFRSIRYLDREISQPASAHATLFPSELRKQLAQRGTMLNHIGLRAINVERVAQFYHEVLGFQHIEAFEWNFPVRYMRRDDLVLHLCEFPGIHNDTILEHQHFAIEVDDHEQIYERARGQQRLRTVESRDYCDDMAGSPPRFFIEDPSGNTLEVVPKLTQL